MSDHAYDSRGIRSNFCEHDVDIPCASAGCGMQKLTQPPPTPGKLDVTTFVIKALEQRREYGIKKYGTSLQTWNGRDPLADAMEEDLDRMQYLAQARIERAELLEKVARLEEEVKMQQYRAESAKGQANHFLRAREESKRIFGYVVFILTSASEHALADAVELARKGRDLLP